MGMSVSPERRAYEAQVWHHGQVAEEQRRLLWAAHRVMSSRWWTASELVEALTDGKPFTQQYLARWANKLYRKPWPGEEGVDDPAASVRALQRWLLTHRGRLVIDDIRLDGWRQPGTSWDQDMWRWRVVPAGGGVS